MPKQSGLGANFYVDQYDVSGDINSVGTISAPLATFDVTDITQKAPERIPGLMDGNLAWTALWNSDPDHFIEVLRDIKRTDVQVSYFQEPELGAPAFSLIGKKVSFDPTRAADGDLKVACSATSNGFGAEWGRQLTDGIVVDTADFDTDGLDTASSAAFGAQLYVHVFSLTGSDATISLEHSSDNGVGDAWAAVDTGSADLAITDVGAWRSQTGRTATVKRWVRISVVGTFTGISLAAHVVKNRALENF